MFIAWPDAFAVELELSHIQRNPVVVEYCLRPHACMVETKYEMVAFPSKSMSKITSSSEESYENL